MALSRNQQVLFGAFVSCEVGKRSGVGLERLHEECTLELAVKREALTPEMELNLPRSHGPVALRLLVDQEEVAQNTIGKPEIGRIRCALQPRGRQDRPLDVKV